MRTRNITLSLPEEDVRQARVLAAERGTLVSRLLAGMLKEFIDNETGYAAAKESSLASLEQGFNPGTGGRGQPVRDELHER